MNKKKLLSLGLVVANMASIPANAAVLNDANLESNNQVKVEINLDEEDTDSDSSTEGDGDNLPALPEVDGSDSITTPDGEGNNSDSSPEEEEDKEDKEEEEDKDLNPSPDEDDIDSPTSPAPPVEGNEDKHSKLTNTVTEERVIETTDGELTVLIEVKAPAVVYGNPLTRSELSGKVIDKETKEKINGEFSWVDGYENLSETAEHQWKFTADDERIENEITGEISVNVRKHDLREFNVTCTEMSFGDKLEESILSGTFYDEFGQKVEGNLVWDNPKQTVIEENGQFHWTFVPYDLEKNNTVKGSLIVRADKSEITAPVVRTISSRSIYKLDEFNPVTGVMEDATTKQVVKGRFRITNKAPKVYNKAEAENVVLEWEFTPENLRKYDIVTGSLTVQANLRPLRLSTPTTTSIKTGNELYESVIKGKATDGLTGKIVDGVWRWEKPWITVHQSGSYSVNFIPNVDNIYHFAGGNAKVSVVSSNKQQELDVVVTHTDDIALGERLRNSNIIGKALDRNTRKVVSGEFYWLDPSIKTTEKEVQRANYIFIPNDIVNYKPFLGEAAVTISDDDVELKKPELVDVSATLARRGQKITNSKISGKALVDGVEVKGKFEWLDKSVNFVQEGLYYETVKFTPAETEKYKVAYINVKVKVYHENQVAIEDVVMSNKNSLDIKLDKKITIEEAKALHVDGYKISRVELLEASDSSNEGRAIARDNGYESSDKIRLVTSQELKGQVRVTVDVSPSGEKLDEEIKPDFVITSNNSGSGSGSGGSTGGSIGGSTGGSTGGNGGSVSEDSNSSSKNESTSSNNSNKVNNEETVKDTNEVLGNWASIDNIWYFVDAEGNKVESKWINNNGLWYYLGENGAMQIGWLKDGTNWYYLNANGTMQTGWLQEGTNWYYLNANGTMQTGWLKDGANWYYLNANGTMKTGWLKEGTTWYYLKSNGEMAKNESVEGYYLGENGALK